MSLADSFRVGVLLGGLRLESGGGIAMLAWGKEG